MSPRAKDIVFTVVVLLVVLVMAKPYIPFLNPTEREFAVTPDPYNVFEQALAENKPIFLEFYAEW